MPDLDDTDELRKQLKKLIPDPQSKDEALNEGKRQARDKVLQL